jgi:iron complex outermembrane recepter protein
MKLLLLNLFLFVLYSSNLIAQTSDSVKVYDLNEITVKSESLIEPKPTTKIGQNILQKYDGSSLFEIAKYIPSVKPQTNSRGESLFYLRGANERQLGLFFDGTLLNIPWDNRVDLSLLPTTNYEELEIIKGVPSSIYGANNIAGVVVGKSKTITSKELSGQLTSQFSEYGYRKMSLLLNRKIGDFSFLISGYNFNRNAYSLSSSFSSSENEKNVRINSDQQTSSIYVKGGYEYQKFSNINISFQFLDSKKGVPPEIGVSSPRYWRYSLWNKIGVNVTGKHNFNFISNSFLDYSFNIYNFRMEIDQFTDDSYSKIDDVEKDNDVVLYGRLIYTLLLNQNSIFRFSGSGYSTIHTESFLSNQYQNVEYQQIVYSAGFEYELLQSDFTFIGGISFDGTNAPKTGNFTEKNNLTALGANSTLKYNFTNYVNTQINIGHKSRFPSLRESYSDGLGRFVVNTDLKPETVNDIELGFEYLIPDGRLFLNILWTHLYDGIVRSTVSTVNRNKFTRVNKDEIRTYGFELEGNNHFSEYLSGGFSFSYLNSYAKNETGTFTDTLEYHPAIIANIFIKSDFAKNINLLIETSAVASEFALEEGNPYYQNIPSYILVNTRLSYKYDLSAVSNVELFGRINNIFDKHYYTQLGLPEAGRELFVGIELQF